jgi:hypothetical protein
VLSNIKTLSPELFYITGARSTGFDVDWSEGNSHSPETGPVYLSFFGCLQWLGFGLRRQISLTGVRSTKRLLNLDNDGKQATKVFRAARSGEKAAWLFRLV